MFEINSLKLLLEEERSITADYTNQANAQLKALEQQNTNLKYEYESKINLLDKQLRIRKGENSGYFFIFTNYIFSEFTRTKIKF